jgi:hypothetical protein
VLAIADEVIERSAASSSRCSAARLLRGHSRRVLSGRKSGEVLPIGLPSDNMYDQSG